MNKNRYLFPLMIANNHCFRGQWEEKTNCAFFMKPFDSNRNDALWENFREEKTLFVSTLTPAKRFNVEEKENPIKFVETYPGKEKFKESFSSFQNSDLDKVILAKKRTLHFENPVDALSIINQVSTKYGFDDLYSYLIGPHEGIVGVSPEILFSRKGRKIWVDCTGGTVKKGEEKKLFTDKIIAEHKFIKDYVVDALKSVCDDIEVSNLQACNKGSISHLNQKVFGTLHYGISDQDLIDLLHPTPAVCGKPRKRALDFLQAHESYNRGLYAGVIGWISELETTLNVALRIAMIKGNTVTLFAGAGITKDSILEEEEEEIENKFNILEEAIACKIHV